MEEKQRTSIYCDEWAYYPLPFRCTRPAHSQQQEREPREHAARYPSALSWRVVLARSALSISEPSQLC